MSLSDQFVSLLSETLKTFTGGEAEIAALSVRRRIFRLANNGITQSTDGREAKAWLRTARGERQGFAVVPSLAGSPDGWRSIACNVTEPHFALCDSALLR